MKSYRLIVLLFFALQFTACGEKGSKFGAKAEGNVGEYRGEPEISFDTILNDMGVIKEGEQVLAWFDYENIGEAPLIINEIKAGCGCTVPKWNAEPLKAGDTESIKVIFDSSGKRGVQDIRITVHSNAKNSKEELRILASVKRLN